MHLMSSQELQKRSEIDSLARLAKQEGKKDRFNNKDRGD